VASTVRRILPVEAETYRKVRLSALADSPAAFGSTHANESLLTDLEWEERARRSSAGTERAMFFALDGDSVVGLAGGYRPEPDTQTVELVSMWTDPAVRRKGVGRQLVNAVIDWAREGGAARVDLWVTRANAPAENLYRAMGFAETGDFQPLPSDPCKDEVKMRLELQPAEVGRRQRG